MQVISVHPTEPKPARIDAAVKVLDAGGIVALPTETFYGLAADSGNEDALARLNRLKGKAEDSPVLLLAADVAQVEALSSAPPAQFRQLAQAFWPGPLTLVLSAAPGLSRAVSGGRGTVGVRVPGLALPRRIARALGRAVSGVSANPHGGPSPRTAGEVAAAFPSGIDLLLDGGPTPGGAASSLVDLSGPVPVLLREGIVRETALRTFLPELTRPIADGAL